MQNNSDNLNKKIKNLVMESANMTNNEDIVMPMNEARGHKKEANEQIDKIRKLEETAWSMQDKRSKI